MARGGQSGQVVEEQQLPLHLSGGPRCRGQQGGVTPCCGVLQVCRMPLGEAPPGASSVGQEMGDPTQRSGSSQLCQASAEGWVRCTWKGRTFPPPAWTSRVLGKKQPCISKQ